MARSDKENQVEVANHTEDAKPIQCGTALPGKTEDDKKRQPWRAWKNESSYEQTVTIHKGDQLQYEAGRKAWDKSQRWSTTLPYPSQPNWHGIRERIYETKSDTTNHQTTKEKEGDSMPIGREK